MADIIRVGGGREPEVIQEAWVSNNSDTKQFTVETDYKHVIVVMTNGNKHTDASKAVGTISISPSRTKTLEKSNYKEGYGWFSSFHSCVFGNVKKGDVITVKASAWLGYYVIYGIN